jgi:hypothetical protein
VLPYLSLEVQAEAGSEEDSLQEVESQDAQRGVDTERLQRRQHLHHQTQGQQSAIKFVARH